MHQAGDDDQEGLPERWIGRGGAGRCLRRRQRLSVRRGPLRDHAQPQRGRLSPAGSPGPAVSQRRHAVHHPFVRQAVHRRGHRQVAASQRTEGRTPEADPDGRPPGGIGGTAKANAADHGHGVPALSGRVLQDRRAGRAVPLPAEHDGPDVRAQDDELLSASARPEPRPSEAGRRGAVVHDGQPPGRGMRQQRLSREELDSAHAAGPDAGAPGHREEDRPPTGPAAIHRSRREGPVHRRSARGRRGLSDERHHGGAAGHQCGEAHGRRRQSRARHQRLREAFVQTIEQECGRRQ